jgi:hypothetical protein
MVVKCLSGNVYDATVNVYERAVKEVGLPALRAREGPQLR